MRKSLLFATTCVGLCFVATVQVNIHAPCTVSYSFNASDTNGIASLHAGWKISSSGTVAYWTTYIIVTSLSHCTSTGTANTRGRYNCGTSARDRAIGFNTYGSFIRSNTLPL